MGAAELRLGGWVNSLGRSQQIMVLFEAVELQLLAARIDGSILIKEDTLLNLDCNTFQAPKFLNKVLPAHILIVRDAGHQIWLHTREWPCSLETSFS